VALPLIATPNAMKFAPWSFSKIETADACPAQFEHRHLLKSAAAAKTSDTSVGTAAHSIIERRVGGASHADATKTALDQTPLTSDELEVLRTLDARIDMFLQKFDSFCKAQGVTEVLVEVEWAFTAAFEPANFWAKDVFFRGKMDLGVVTRDRDLIVIDHKSGYAKDIKRDIKKKQQLQAYAILGVSNVSNINGVRGAIHYLQGDEAKAIQWVDYVDAQRVRDVYVPWLYTRINETASTLNPPFLAKPSLRWPCEWCGYQAYCTPYQEMVGGAS
jgi:CRISPR/Cas system-associated exonuclease Cas4 (RecB family)